MLNNTITVSFMVLSIPDCFYQGNWDATEHVSNSGQKTFIKDGIIGVTDVRFVYDPLPSYE